MWTCASSLKGFRLQRAAGRAAKRPNYAPDIVALGHKLPRTAYPSRDEAMEKLLQSAVQSRVHALCFDNVDQPISGSVLAGLSTHCISEWQLGFSAR